jgi:alkane 1-monooxygenase
VQSILGSWKSAWQIESDRLRKLNQFVLSWNHACLRFVVAQLIWLVLIGYLWGISSSLFALAAGLVGVLLLETVNYIEHYALRRTILPSGRPEPVRPAHSWNSNHELGRILLYELTRHSDHHYKSNRKYQVLRHLEESPQLPTGYPGCMVLALFPPLWFAIIHPRVG